MAMFFLIISPSHQNIWRMLLLGNILWMTRVTVPVSRSWHIFDICIHARGSVAFYQISFKHVKWFIVSELFASPMLFVYFFVAYLTRYCYNNISGIIHGLRHEHYSITIHMKNGQEYRINPLFLSFATRFATSYMRWRQPSLFHISLALYIQNHCKISRHNCNVTTITQKPLPWP